MAPGAPPLVLASGSAARRGLMEAAGLRFTVQPVDLDELALKAVMQMQRVDPSDAAMRLANTKAEQIQEPNALVIGSDQLLVCQEAWFDKPPDLQAARAHLLRLRGQRHELFTAVTCWRDGTCLWQHLERPTLVMRRFSEAFLDAYLAAQGDALLSSVGAYRLEGQGLHLFDRVEGQYAAVLGLPMLPLLGFLRKLGVVID